MQLSRLSQHGFRGAGVRQARASVGACRHPTATGTKGGVGQLYRGMGVVPPPFGKPWSAGCEVASDDPTITKPHTSHMRTRGRARARGLAAKTGVGRQVAIDRVPDPLTIAKACCWLVRDRGTTSVRNLYGVTRWELELASRARRPPKRPVRAYASFEESLQAAIDLGWVVAYVAGDGRRYAPNYCRDPGQQGDGERPRLAQGRPHEQ